VRDLPQRPVPTDEPRYEGRQIMTLVSGCLGLMSRAVPAHGHKRRPKASLVVRLKMQCGDQPLGSVAVRVRRAPFELLNAVDTQASTFHKLLLRQAGRVSVMPQELWDG
jgi:hypothetical protein